MGFATKVAHCLADPVFYRKSFYELLRNFRQFKEAPLMISQGDLKSIKRALVVVAHPDDETFCSGIISALKANRSDVTVICVTRGEGGPTGGAKREDLASIREREMMAACKALSVDQVFFLDHVDPVGGAYRVYAPDVSADQLAAEISAHSDQVDLVISHGSSGEYWHAAHLLVYAAVRKMIGAKGKESPPWITFFARDTDHLLPHLLNEDDEADLRIDCTAFHSHRLEALNSHQSQLGLFRRFAGGTSDDFVKMTSLESYCVQSGEVGCITNRETD